ncbi:hypothetical protein L9F63_009900, partial [Diploptera punctata]
TTSYYWSSRRVFRSDVFTTVLSIWIFRWDMAEEGIEMGQLMKTKMTPMFYPLYLTINFP